MCEMSLPDGSLRPIPGLDLVTDFGLLVPKLPTLAADYASGDFSPTISS